ncbi:MAG: hypothetical protein ABEJ86_01855 [Halococcoides sp.]
MTPGSSATEVSGVFLTAIPRALRQACGSCHDSVTTILDDEGVSEPDPAAWYDLADCLAVYDRIESDVGRCTLFVIGRGLARSMDWPDHDRIDDALSALAEQYDRYHRRCDRWPITLDSEGRGVGTITFETPYPTVMEAGLVRGVDDRFGDEETFLAVRQGSSDRSLAVHWWDEGIDHVDQLVPSWTSGDDIDPDPRRANRVETPASR